MYIQIRIILPIAIIVADASCIIKRTSEGETSVNFDETSMRLTHHASLIINVNYACAASLITKKHLLSVAHCVSMLIQLGPSVATPFVVFGRGTLAGGIIHSVRRISHHKDFVSHRPYFYENDISVIHLDDTIDFVNIFPIAMPPARLFIPENSEVLVSGFHLITSPETRSRRISNLRLRTISLQNCQYHLSNFTLLQTQVCTMASDSMGCSPGDEGAAMVDMNQKFILGILSVPANGLVNRTVDIYTKVSSYRDYIVQELRYTRAVEIFSNQHWPHPYYNY